MSQGNRMVNALFVKNYLKLTVQFFSGKKQLRTAKAARRKIISMHLPAGIELVLAADAMPIFLCRIGDYSQQEFLRAARLYQGVFGWNLLTSGMQFLRPFLGNNFFSDIIDKFLTGLYSTYEKYIEIAENAGSPLDACFGTRILLGATWPHLNQIHGTLGYCLRCGWFSKAFEEISEKSEVIFLEVPNIVNSHAEEMMKESLNQVISQLEKITGKTITSEKLRTQTLLLNEIRSSYSKIIELASQNILRLSPLSYANLLSMLHIGFTDCVGDPKFFNQTLKLLVKDLEKIPKNSGIDATNRPKLLLVNAFGGYEPHLPEFVDTLGGRLFVADWDVFKILDPIETSGDMLKNYADAILRFESFWIDNSTLVDRYIEVASKFNIDAILFNNMYGCKSITPSLRLFKERLHDTDLRLVDIGFQNIGDNYEQLKTRIGAMLELIQEERG